MSLAVRLMPMRWATRTMVEVSCEYSPMSKSSPLTSRVSMASAKTLQAAKRRQSCNRASAMRSRPPWSPMTAATMSLYLRAMSERPSMLGSRSLWFVTRLRDVRGTAANGGLAAGIHPQISACFRHIYLRSYLFSGGNSNLK